MTIRQISPEELRLRQAEMAKLASAKAGASNGNQNVSTVSAEGRYPAVQTPRESGNLDVKNLEKLFTINGSNKVSEAQQAAAGTVAAPVSVAEPKPAEQLAKVDAQKAIDEKSATKTAIQSAIKFNAAVASNAYTRTATANAGFKTYDKLSGVSISDTKLSNPFAAIPENNGSNYTLGLNFAGDRNIDNRRYMEIA